jgi:hypothetical protein
MNRLAVISFFRNSERNGQIYPYFSQLAALQVAWPGELRLIAIYGDCVDRTKRALLEQSERIGIDIELGEHNHGQPEFGQTERPERLTALTHLMNFGLAHVRTTDDLVWYVESDLIWHCDIVPRLARTLRTRDADVVAPLILADGCFYDIWAFRKNGERFSPFNPFHSALVMEPVTEVDSAGSALLMTGVAARWCRGRGDQALVSFCDDVRAKGGRILVDSREIVKHPC